MSNTAPKRIEVFISHSHDESKLALALSELLESVSGGMIQCWLSSDQSSDGGIPPGMKWNEVILAKIRQTDFMIAILSTRSLARPWVLWECGIASGIHGETGIIPVLYSLSLDDFKSPLDVYESFEGDKEDGIHSLCGKLVSETGLVWRPENFEVPFANYMQTVSLFKPPRIPSQQVIDANIRKIEKLENAGRSHEFEAIEQFLQTAYGDDTAIDYQIHDLLSESFLRDLKPELALQQIDKGLELEPDNLQLLHRKGLALLELDRPEECRSVVDHLIELDQRLVFNTEIAGLRGRMFRQLSDPESALQAYLQAFEADKYSYYCGENVVNLLIDLNRWEEARTRSNKVLEACENLERAGKTSFWLDFSKGKMLLCEKRYEEALQAYSTGLGRLPAPGPRERVSASASLERLVESGFEKKENVAPILECLDTNS